MPSSASTTSYLSSLSLHDALPISALVHAGWKGTSKEILKSTLNEYDGHPADLNIIIGISINQSHYEVDEKVIDALDDRYLKDAVVRSEEHTSELQSRGHLVCRLLLPLPLTSRLFPYTTLFRSQHWSMQDGRALLRKY